MINQNTEFLTREALATEDWHALYVRHQHEKAIEANLRRNDFEALTPAYSSIRKWKDRTRRLMVPLFPGYVFLHGGLKFKSKILATPGVCSFVTFGGVPATIPEAEIESIRRVTESSCAVEPHPYLKCGDRVRIISGQLTGIEGLLVRRKSSLRLVLSADMLERSIAVEIDASEVEPIPETSTVRSALAGVGQ